MLRADLPQSASFDIQPMHLKQRFSLKIIRSNANFQMYVFEATPD